jgi:hypothetical protein
MVPVEKTLRKLRKKLNCCHRMMVTMTTMTTRTTTMTTTMIMRIKRKKTMRMNTKMMRITLP